MWLFRFYLNYIRISFYFEWVFYFFKRSEFSIGLFLDKISFLFLGVVCLISRSIISYSYYYIIGEANYLRFVFVLCLFVLSIIFLIISPNFISLLLGWDGLGLSSYCLVIFYQNEIAM